MFDKVVGTFEDLIRRSIGPSVTFFVVAITVDLLGAQVWGAGASERMDGYVNFIRHMPGGRSPGVVFAVMFVFIVGVSYALSTLQQIAFDNRQKANFVPLRSQWRDWWNRSKTGSETVSDRLAHRWTRREVIALQQLRENVVSRFKYQCVGCLQEKEQAPLLTDYVLYEILAGIEHTKVRPFVDSAKAMGVFFVSAILVLLGNLAFNPDFYSWPAAAACVGLSIAAYWVGFNVTCAQYRMRALRLYVNALAMPSAQFQKLRGMIGSDLTGAVSSGTSP